MQNVPEGTRSKPCPVIDPSTFPAGKLDFDPVTSTGETPLCLAIMHGQQKAIEFIASYNKSTDSDDQRFDLNFRRLRGGFTPLHIAVVINNVPAIQTLLHNS